jgi:Tol biopolymer transport system component
LGPHAAGRILTTLDGDEAVLVSVESKAPGWLHVALAVVSGVVALAACAPLADATLPGRNGEIAYGIVDEIDSSDGIYFAGFYIGAVDPRSGRQHRIGRHIDDDGLDAIEPAYSPDGNLLAVQWDDEPGWGIVLTRPDGTPVRRLTRKHDRSPSWAPGGRRLAFDRRRCGDEQCESLGIHTIGTRGKNRRLVVDNGVDPAWSARGEIAFVAEPQPWRFYDNQGPIQVTDSHGTGVRTLVDEGSAPDWSPRGDRLTFVRSRGEYSGLFVVKADGTGLRRLRLTERGSFGSPVWSPDGRRIAFLWGDELHTISPSARQR